MAVSCVDGHSAGRDGGQFAHACLFSGQDMLGTYPFPKPHSQKGKVSTSRVSQPHFDGARLGDSHSVLGES